MYLTGIGTAVPVQRYTQRDCWEALCESGQLSRLSNRSQAILRKVLTGNSGIQFRHLALDRLQDAFSLSPDALHERFRRNAPMLATQAAERALQDADTTAGEIDAILVSTCTGYLCPGLTSYVSERLGLKGGVFPLDLVGQGCGAALPNLVTAEALIGSGRCRKVLSICVEVCSAAFYLDDDPGVLVSACLFGDGAAAAVLGLEPGPRHSVRWTTAGSLLRPDNRESLRFEQRQGMLRNILAPEVPNMAAAAVADLLDRTLRSAHLVQSDVSGWIMHPGGRDVLAKISETLRLDPAQLRHSAGVLQEYGNLSSPSVLFVLERALQDSIPRGRWWMSSFGAGFSCYGALLEVA